MSAVTTTTILNEPMDLRIISDLWPPWFQSKGEAIEIDIFKCCKWWLVVVVVREAPGSILSPDQCQLTFSWPLFVQPLAQYRLWVRIRSGSISLLDVHFDNSPLCCTLFEDNIARSCSALLCSCSTLLPLLLCSALRGEVSAAFQPLMGARETFTGYQGFRSR